MAFYKPFLWWLEIAEEHLHSQDHTLIANVYKIYLDKTMNARGAAICKICSHDTFQMFNNLYIDQ